MLAARLSLLAALLFLSLAGCAGDEAPLFERLPPERTGVRFANTIVENDTLLNPLVFDYVYNGAGVGVGDFNGDGRPDLYFAGNVVDNRLYLNRGGLRFEDVTEAAGVAAEGAWSTGVTVVDINQDGLLDIYVCVAGPAPKDPREKDEKWANLLFVNQGVDENGVPVFEEQAEEYGIADTGYSVHAAFFDYDGDGDLDLYVLTNAREHFRHRIHPVRTQGQAPSTDRLYRNDPGSPDRSPGQAQFGAGSDRHFTDVSEEAGITIEGYGLGVVVSDINKDGWPDVYVANDFLTNDLLWINNGDGTFTNRAGQLLKHQSRNGMGADVADFNNDGLPDIVVLDMLPWSNRRKKMMAPPGSYDTFHMLLRLGYQPQYVRNTLQLNRGVSPEGHLTFSEIGRLAGIHATDWSWAPLFADFDNDGWKDLFVTNGFGKDVTNLDFIAYQEQTLMLGGGGASTLQAMTAALDELPEVKVPNRIFHNDGDPGSSPGQVLTFTDKTEDWGLGIPSLSNGAAFVDLDGDGDLDLVTNNIDAPAFLFENHAAGRDSSHFLQVRLEGPPGNLGGFGAKLVLRADRTGGRKQYRDHTPYRGYQSSVGRLVHFGLGADSTADLLEVFWPDGRYQRLTDVPADQVLTVRYEDAAPEETVEDRRYVFASVTPERRYPFEEVTRQRGLVYAHAAHPVADFKRSPLVPHKLSHGGPALAVGDVDGNGLDDVYVGGDRGVGRFLFLQTAPGQFTRRPFLPGAEAHEDRGALFFDADGDGDLDLYVVSGGSDAPAGDATYQDRLYLNDGTGHFRRAEGALPEERTSGSTVVAADYDADGDLGLFVGGRVVPGRYPLPPRSYLLRNDSENGEARFTDVTGEAAPELAEDGMVTSALWTDFNRDGRIDLLVAGEWMPITFFENTGEGFVDATASTGLEKTSGWWHSLAAGDFDNDGDIDYVAGNLGLNSKYKASEEEPVRIYAKDFDQNGSIDPVMSRYIQGRSHPVPMRDRLVEQIVGIRHRFPTYAAYAEATFEEVFTEEELEGAYVAEAVRFETSYLENEGEGAFTIHPLPIRAQFAPVFGMRPGDYDGDGNLDLLLVGNSYASHTRAGWYDAMVGSLLRGDGAGGFEAVPHTESGFFVDGDAKALAEVMTSADGPPLVLATQHADSLKAFTRPLPSGTRFIRLRPLDRYAVLTFEDGRTRRQEFYHGAGYLSQSSRSPAAPDALTKAVIYDSEGNRRVMRF